MPDTIGDNAFLIDAFRSGFQMSKEAELLIGMPVRQMSDLQDRIKEITPGLALTNEVELITVANKAHNQAQEVINRYGARPVELFLSDEGKAQNNPALVETLFSAGAYGTRKQEVGLGLLRTKRFRGRLHAVDLLANRLDLKPLPGHRAWVRNGFYVARVMSEDGMTPLVYAEYIDYPKLSERYKALGLVAGIVRR